MITYRIQKQNQAERGGALAMIILSVAGLAALSAAMMTVGLSSSREQSAESLESQAEYICQAGLSQSVYLMRRGLDANVGSPTHQQSWGGGRFWVTAVAAGPTLTRLTANGLDNGVGTSQELVVKLRKAFADLREDLKGNHDNPTNEIPGLIEIGDGLLTTVQKVTQGGG